MPVAIPIQTKLEQKIKEVMEIDKQCQKVLLKIDDPSTISTELIQTTVELYENLESINVTTETIQEFHKIGSAII